METHEVRLRLKNEPENYSFTVDTRSDPPFLHIPGYHRGPDICIPKYPEQVEWLNGLTEYMTPFWDCMWRFLSREAYLLFQEHLRKVTLEPLQTRIL